MSIEPIRTEVRSLLAEAKDDIRQAERALAYGIAEARVRAAGRLVGLKQRKAELEQRMRELDHSRGGAMDTVVQWVREDWMILMQTLEHWIGAH
jgi:hypothetical protein